MMLRASPIALALVALLAGCGGGHDATEKQIAELRAEIVKLRAEQARAAERLDALDLALGTYKAPFDDGGSPGKPGSAPKPPGTPASSAPPPAADRPDLNVVRLAPGNANAEADGDADSDAPRPVIRAVGPGPAPGPKKPDKPGAVKKKPPTADPRPGLNP